MISSSSSSSITIVIIISCLLGAGVLEVVPSRQLALQRVGGAEDL